MICAPPEVVIEPPSQNNGFNWVWAVCQPDAHWAELEGGRASSMEAAARAAQDALARIERMRRVLR